MSRCIRFVIQIYLWLGNLSLRFSTATSCCPNNSPRHLYLTFQPYLASMSIVTFNVSCSTAKVGSERRFDKGTTIIGIKEKLELVVGVPAASMRLVVKTDDGSVVCELSDNNAMLGAYPVMDYMNLHVRASATAHMANTKRSFHAIILGG